MMNNNDKNLYPIRDVSEITGVNAVTLRAWQRRYGLIKPQRTDKGHRLYTDEDITLIKTILEWLDKGVAIRNVKALLEGQTNRVNAQTQLSETANLLDALAKLDTNKAESLLVNTLKDYPFSSFKKQFFEPLEKALKSASRPHRGLQYSLWRTLIIQTLSGKVRSLGKANSKTCWLIRCGQRGHTLAWLTAYELSMKGYQVNVIDGIQEKLAPFASLIEANTRTKVVVVGDEKLNPFILKELQQLPKKPTLLGSIATIHQSDFDTV